MAAATAIGLTPLIALPATSMAATNTGPTVQAADTGITDITSVGSIQLNGITDKDGNKYSGTDPDGNHVDGQPIPAQNPTIHYTLKGSVDLTKVKAGDRIGINIGINDPNGRITGYSSLTGPTKLTDSNGRTIFTVDWNRDGQTIILTRTTEAEVGTYHFDLHNSQSYLASDPGKAPDAGRVSFTLAGRTWTLDYAKYTPAPTPDDWQCVTPVEASHRSYTNAASVNLWFDYKGCADQDRFLAGQDPATDTKDLVYYLRVHKPDSGQIDTISPDTLYMEWHGVYDATHESGQHKYTFNRSYTKVDARADSAQQAATLIKPGEYLAYPDSDGTYVLALNMGPRQGANALHPTVDQLNGQVDRPADLEAITRMTNAGLSATNMSVRFDLLPKDGNDTIFRADATLTTLRNGQATSYDTVLRTNPGGQLGDGQAGFRFDAHGGQGSMTDLIGEGLTSVKLPHETFTRKGYTFAGWNTKPDGSGETHHEGDTLTLPKNGVITTLYAQWTANPSTITYDANGGAPQPEPQKGRVDETVTVAAKPAKTGMDFTGWLGSDGHTYQPGEPVTYPDGGLTLTAQWKASRADLTYDPNGGTGDPADQPGTVGGEQTVSGVKPTRTGYTFTGWKAPDGSVKQGGDKVTLPAGGLNLTAQWRANTYTVAFQPGGGRGDMKDQPFTWDQDGQLAANAFTRPGYTFTGWKADNGHTYADKATVRNLTDRDKGVVTLTAQWEAGDSALTYDANGGTGAPASQPGKTDQKANVSDTVPTRVGYSFDGWRAPDGSVKHGGDTVTLPAGGLKLTAVWRADPSTIRFDAHGGTGAPTDMDGVTDQEGRVPDQKPTRAGYSFTRWTTGEDGSGTGYDPTDPIRFPAGGVMLHAQWKADDSVLSYNANGGVNAPASQTGVTDGTLTVAKTEPKRDGYRFDGWKAPDGSVKHADDKVTMPAGGMTLTAQWTALPASITYQANHEKATGATGATDGTTDQDVAFAGNGFRVPGYSFIEWNTKDDGSGTGYRPGAVISLPAGGLTVYAKWGADPHRVFYDGNNGRGDMTATDGHTDQKVTLAANGFMRAGYTFTGWNTKADGSGTPYGDKATLTLGASDVTLFAQWRADAASITYVANYDHPTGATGPTTGVTDGRVRVAGNGFTREAYRFLGWNTKADGSGVKYEPGDEVILHPGGLTLYAQWRAESTMLPGTGGPGVLLLPAGLLLAVGGGAWALRRRRE